MYHVQTEGEKVRRYDQDTLAEILVERGYLTGLVADVYHMFKPTMNYTRGFCTYDFIRGQETDNWRGGALAEIEQQLQKDKAELAAKETALADLKNNLSAEEERPALIRQQLSSVKSQISEIELGPSGANNDDAEADVLGAIAAGLQGALVRTGKYRPGDEERLENTTATVFRNLEELSKSLKKS